VVIIFPDQRHRPSLQNEAYPGPKIIQEKLASPRKEKKRKENTKSRRRSGEGEGE
jgi:hypothetical protein